MDNPKIFFICGTRPDAIKTAPVVLELRRYSDRAKTVLVSTGQHKEMLDHALGAFHLVPDYDLAIMSHEQTLTQVTTRGLEGLSQLLQAEKPNIVVVQGDTTTTFIAALAAFYARIPIAHIEAGLRTDSISNPFPEEFNRRVAGLISSVHFPPTQLAKQNLLREGFKEETIFVTGNTGIDALNCLATSDVEWYPEHNGPVLLVTTHRRENLGEPQRRIARSVHRLLEAHPNLLAVLPMHKNPPVRETLRAVLGQHPRARLIEPPEYAHFVQLIRRATVVLTDSGGVQEEAPTFGKPLLVLRDTTERPEGVAAGVARLIGTEEEAIFSEADRLLRDPEAYRSMSEVGSPYGDGRASERIRYILLQQLGIDSPKVDMWT